MSNNLNLQLNDVAYQNFGFNVYLTKDTLDLNEEIDLSSFQQVLPTVSIGATNTHIYAQATAPITAIEGDLWFDTDDDNTIYRWTSGSWTSVKDGGIAGKITTFFQDGIPTSLSAGDLWFDTNDTNKLYRAAAAGADQITAGEWVAAIDTDIAQAISDAATAQSTADGKIVTFYQSAVPTATDAGDLWYDTDDGKTYRATAAGDDQITAGEWERIDVGLNPTLIDALNTTNAPAAAGADVTAANTAAAIASQGALATANTADFDTQVAGAEKPDDNATVGAIAGTNLKDSSANTLGDTDIMNIKSMVAGATINGATLPVPVYQNTTDNEVYACDGNDTAKLKFIGFAISNSTDGNAINVQIAGRVAGFTGLTEGVNYFVQDAVGTIGVAKGTYVVLVGVATSATEIKIISENDEGSQAEFIASDVLRASLDTERNSGGDPALVKVKEFSVKHAGTIRIKFDLKSQSGGTSVKGRIYINGVAVGTLQANDTTSYVTFSQDISGIDGDDEIELWIGQSGAYAYARNFRLYWNKISVIDYTENYDSNP